MNDGLFEVMLVRNPKNILHLQEIITAVVSGKESDNSLVRFKTRKLEIISETPLAWTRDGENGGEHTHVMLENLHQAFEILVKNTSDLQSAGSLTEGAAAESAVTVEAENPSEPAENPEDTCEGSEVPDAEDDKELSGNIFTRSTGMPVPVEMMVQALERAISEITAEFAAKLQNE